MINGKSIISIIPARDGSKGLPGKNIKKLHGQPLISWTIKQALSSAYIDTVVVSTDSQDIANTSEAYGAQVPFIRPHVLATDDDALCQWFSIALVLDRRRATRDFSPG